jgi:uncharacterized membrane protein YkvA (DUF1232 family)
MLAGRGQRPDLQSTAGFLGEIIRQLRLIVRLMVDRDVPIWVKTVPVLMVLYLLSPLDLVPDPILGLGQVDDLAIFLIGLKLFVDLCPRDVVRRLREEPSGQSPEDAEGDVVDSTYRILDE